jgi:hypothetical protein
METKAMKECMREERAACSSHPPLPAVAPPHNAATQLFWYASLAVRTTVMGRMLPLMVAVVAIVGVPEGGGPGVCTPAVALAAWQRCQQRWHLTSVAAAAVDGDGRQRYPVEWLMTTWACRPLVMHRSYEVMKSAVVVHRWRRKHGCGRGIRLFFYAYADSGLIIPLFT